MRLLEADATDMCISPKPDALADAAAGVAHDLGVRVWRIGAGYFGPDWTTATSIPFPRTRDSLLNTAERIDGAILNRLTSLRDAPAPIWSSAASVVTRLRHPLSSARHLPDILRTHPYTLIVARPGLTEATWQEQLFRSAITTAARHAPMDRHVVIRLSPNDLPASRWRFKMRRLIRQSGLGDQVHFMKGGSLETLVAEAKGVMSNAMPIAALTLRTGTPLFPINIPFHAAPVFPSSSGTKAFWNGEQFDDQEARLAMLKLLTVMQVRGAVNGRAKRAEVISRIAKRLTKMPEQAKVIELPVEDALAKSA